MIKHLVIENFKKFQRIELNLKDMTVLMGENGCGKTSILQAIALALRLISTTDLFQCESNSNRIRFRKKGYLILSSQDSLLKILQIYFLQNR